MSGDEREPTSVDVEAIAEWKLGIGDLGEFPHNSVDIGGDAVGAYGERNFEVSAFGYKHRPLNSRGTRYLCRHIFDIALINVRRIFYVYTDAKLLSECDGCRIDRAGAFDDQSRLIAVALHAPGFRILRESESPTPQQG